MKYYVVVADWSVGRKAGGHEVVGVYTSREAAIAALKERVATDDKPLADKYGYEIFEDNELRFDAHNDEDRLYVGIEEAESNPRRVVKSTKLYTPQSFVETLTGRTYVFRSDSDAEEIHKLLRGNGVETDDAPLWDYPLDEIDHVIETGVPVVLVETQSWDEKKAEYVKELRWFEVPEDFGK